MNFSSQLSWIFFVSRRFALIDSRGKTALTTFLASLGIGFGVMTLIVTISVMNGFQIGYIKNILEVSSYHIRAKNLSPEDLQTLADHEILQKNISSITPFYDAQALIVSDSKSQQGALIRALPQNVLEKDAAFKAQVNMRGGTFDLSDPSFIVIGNDLAYLLGARVGDEVSLFALSGNQEVELFSDDRTFVITGIFSTGYNEINATFAFVSDQNTEKLFGVSAMPTVGIKLFDFTTDMRTINVLKGIFPHAEFESWQSYNRSFFGALRVEKNTLFLLVFLIFIVVGVNIYNAMRRIVYERKEEICALSALGAKKSEVQFVFILQGFLVGLCGTLPGVLFGLLICIKIDLIFVFFSQISYDVQYFLTMLFNPENIMYLQKNLTFLYFSKIPALIIYSEVLFISLFGIFSSLLAAWMASTSILRLSIAEVLRDE
ncbi:MAG: FtsX-like permease family protein [Treponemataceae bacterium]